MSPFGTFETCRRTLRMSAVRGRPEVTGRHSRGRRSRAAAMVEARARAIRPRPGRLVSTAAPPGRARAHPASEQSNELRALRCLLIFANAGAKEVPRSRFWVKNAVLSLCQPLPVYPHQRTFAGCVGMSQRCQQATLFDRYSGPLSIQSKPERFHGNRGNLFNKYDNRTCSPSLKAHT